MILKKCVKMLFLIRINFLWCYKLFIWFNKCEINKDVLNGRLKYLFFYECFVF